MKTLNILAFFTIVSSPLFAKEVKEVNSTTPTPVTITGASAQSPTWTQDISNKHNPSLLKAFSIHNQALFDKDYVKNLEEENKKLKSQNTQLSSQVALNPWPFDSWLYFPEVGWIYLTSDAFPWAYISSPDLQIFAWVFVTSFIVLKVIDSIVGIRATDNDEEIGLDKSEIGVEAYPDFK